ncbi:MAG: ABC transporter ATP-binding protein [Phycisphaerales bacterium]|nr:ABC transporter ATP-binding protein [Phycisphaerales bacterium]
MTTAYAEGVIGALDEARSPIVRAVGLSKWLGGRPVLRGVDLTVGTSQCVALLGANGAGKSTLLRILSTLTRPTAGRLELFGLDATRAGALLRARIGVIGHQLMLYRELTVRENLELFGRLYGLGHVGARVGEVLGLVGLESRAEDRVRELSRGLAQRVSIGRALMHRPELLLADEPFTGLDTESAERLESIVRGHRAGGGSVVLATHDAAQAARLADRVAVLRGGRIALHEPAGGHDPDALAACSRSLA